MEYRVIRRQSRNLEAGFSALEDLVNENLAQGWQLAGGTCVETYELGFVFVQAMVRVRPPSSGNNRTTFLNNVNRMRG